MKKLTLDLDSLLVESFDTDAGAGEHGTVRAHSFPASEFDDCGLTGDTCAKGCGGSAATCGGITDPCLCDPIHPEREVDFG